MKMYFYKITFEIGESIELYASTNLEAIIVAKAEKIKAGLNSDVQCLVCAETETLLIRPKVSLC